MKYLNEFRDPARIRALAETIAREVTQPWTLMEICGGQTHAIARYALQDLLPPTLELVHGPGCPVCVTPAELIGKARRIALEHDALLSSYGDMLRVPGPDGDLLDARAHGADVAVVLSPLDALQRARAQPEREVVFFAVGFETTTPASAAAIQMAHELRLENFSVLAAHVRVPPAMELILSSPRNRVQGFLAAGHVCTITGTSEYPEIARRFGVPVVITGFEPVDILVGVLAAVRQLEANRAVVENRYARSVRASGNRRAQEALDQVFEVVDRPWRGIGIVPGGGYAIRERFGRFDAERRFPLRVAAVEEAAECRAAEVLQGWLKPPDCAAFGNACTPERPMGAPMVSTEGACAAYHRFRSRSSAEVRS